MCATLIGLGDEEKRATLRKRHDSRNGDLLEDNHGYAIIVAMADRSWSVRDWDTAFFGVHIGEATLDSVTELDDISGWAAAEGLDCVYVRSDGRDVAAITAAIRCGAVLVDLRLTMASEELAGDAQAAVRAADERDRPWLRRAAAELAGVSRFSRD